MTNRVAGRKLKAFRAERGLTLEQAGALIVVDGKPVDKATWHAWETNRKIPKAAWMFELEQLVPGLEPNDFYTRPDGAVQPEPPAQAALAL